MEKNKKDLKLLSILILVLACLSLLMSIIGVCVRGLPQPTEIPEGMTKELVQISTIIAFVLGLVVLIPHIYVGVKGICIANGSSNSKGLLVVTIVLIVLASVSTITGISNLIKLFDLSNALALVGSILDIVIFVCYYLTARKVIG